MNRARDLELKDETIRFRPLFPYGNADATAVADGTAIEIGGAVVSLQHDGNCGPLPTRLRRCGCSSSPRRRCGDGGAWQGALRLKGLRRAKTR